MNDPSQRALTEEQLWSFFDQYRGIEEAAPSDFLDYAREQGVEPTLTDLDHFFRGTRGYEEYSTPSLLPSFVETLAEAIGADRVLDPWAGAGSLLEAAVNGADATLGIGLVINPDVYEAVQEISHSKRLRWHRGWIDDVYGELSDAPYDLIIGSPPWNWTPQDAEERDIPVGLRRNAELYQLLRASQLLSSDGTIVFLHHASLFTRPGKTFRQELDKQELSIDGVFVLPRGSQQYSPSLRPYLITISHQFADDLFVAEVAEDRDQSQIVQNWRKRGEGASKSLGALVSRSEFRSFEALENQWRAQRLASNQPYAAVALEEIAVEWERPSEGTPVDSQNTGNTIYVPQQVDRRVLSRGDEVPEGVLKYVPVHLDPSEAAAEFAADFLNTELGRALRRSLAIGAVTPRIKLDDIPELKLYLPDIEVQERVVAARSEIDEISHHLDQLSRRVLEHPKAVGSVESELNKISLENTLGEWLKQLPFPVASILERYVAEDRPRRERDYLFHFFEGLAEFNATVLLSAFAGSDLSDFDSEDLTEELRKASLGNWVNVGSRLGKKARTMLSGDNPKRQRCLELFSAGSEEWVQALISKSLYGTLQRATERRNAWRGHGGVLGDSEAKRQANELENLLTEAQSNIGDRYRRVSLLLPHEGKLKNGVWTFTVSKLMGPSTTFRRDRIQTVEPLEQETLYLLEDGMEAPLELLPFVKLMAPPESEHRACYFYNRVDGEGTRWVSYHFEEDASRHTPESDFEILSNRLKSVGKDQNS